MKRRTRRIARAAVKAAPDSGLLASKLRLLGVALICAKVALVPVVFDYAADFPFPVAKALLSHWLAYALVGVMAGLLVQFGRSLVVWSWIHVPVLAFLLANAIATMFALDKEVALFGTHARMLGLGTTADFVVLYFAIASLVRTRTEAIAVIASGLAASVLVLGYEFVQLVGRDPLDWNSPGTVRPFSTLGQTTTLAEYLTVLMVGAVGLALFEAKVRVPLRAALLGYAVLLLGGALLTQTRSALLGLVAGAALLVVLTWLAHPNHRARATSVVGAALSVAAIALILVFTPFGARVLSTVDKPGTDMTGDQSGLRLEESAEGRVGLYAAALQMVRDRPVFGYGPDNFSAAFPTYRSELEPSEIQGSLPTSAHSWVAQIAATSGLVGLVAFTAIALSAVIFTVKSGFRPVAWAAAAMLGAFLGAGITTVSDIGTDWLFWASAGAIAAVTSQPSPGGPTVGRPVRSGRDGHRRDDPISRLRGAAAITFVGAAIAIVATGTSGLSASHSNRDSRLLRLAGSPKRAVDAALNATASDPGRAEYWDGLGLAYVSDQRLTDAASAFAQAANRAPYDVGYWGDLASANLVLFQRGDATATARARDAAERAVQADKNNPLASLSLAVVMQVTGNLPEAVSSIERALVLDPQSKNGALYVTATQVYVASGRPADAIRTARKGVGLVSPPIATVTLRVELARALVAAGRPMDALIELDEALAIQPNQPVAIQLRAEIRAGLTR